MNKAVKKSERNNPVKKSLRIKKQEVADLDWEEKFIEAMDYLEVRNEDRSK